MSAATFLAPSLDGGAKPGTPTGASKGGAGGTDLIRALLREQQKNCQVLHANPLFKEFRSIGQQKKAFGKGYQVVEESTPNFGDVDAEGQARLFELIKNTATKEEKTLQGVWAAFGQPYVCLGEPDNPKATLPKLARDEINGAEVARSFSKKGSRSSALQSKQSVDSTAQGPSQAGASHTAQGNSASPSCASRTGKLGETGKEAGGGGACDPEVMLNKMKSVLKAGTADREESKFPSGVLRGAESRVARSKAASATFMNRREADAEMAHPDRAYGQPMLRSKLQLAPLPSGVRREEACGPEDAAKSFFLTQAPGAQAGLDGYSSADERRSAAGTSSQGMMRRSEGMRAPLQGISGGNSLPLDGSFRPIVDLTEPLKGDEDNPVYKWHNDFIATRQHGRAQLQAALYERATGRYKARTDLTSAAGMATTLFGQLNLSHGRMLGANNPHGKVVSPYKRLEAFQAQQEAAKRNSKARAVQALEPGEIRILQRFYDQLCALVEAQRMSDPLCLMVVHKVKSLLEAGTYLHRPMLQAVLDHIAAFSKGTGTLKYNKYLLAALTFITRCVGLEESDLESLVESMGICVVVYGTEQTPSSLAAEQLAAAAAADAAAKKAKRSGDGQAAGTSGGAADAQEEGTGSGRGGEGSEGGTGGSGVGGAVIAAGGDGTAQDEQSHPPR